MCRGGATRWITRTGSATSKEKFSSKAVWTSSVSCAGDPGRYLVEIIVAHLVVVLIVVYLPIVNICLVQASDPSVQGPAEGKPEEVLGSVRPEGQTQAQQGQQGTYREEEARHGRVRGT